MTGVGGRAFFNRCRRRLVHWLQFRIVFGEQFGGRELPHTRISASSWIDAPQRLELADHVYIGPFCLVEASAGVRIEEGVQITSHVSIVSHSSHRAQRLLGPLFADWRPDRGERPGWIAGPVVIGAYSFIGPHALIEAGTQIGRGSIVRAGSVVRGRFPDFAVLEGNPARVVGDSRDGDRKGLERHPELREGYERWVNGR